MTKTRAVLLVLLWPVSGLAAGRMLIPFEGPSGAAQKAEKATLAALNRLKRPAAVAPLSLSDIRLAVDCGDDSPKCIEQIAKTLEADELLLGKAEKADANIRVTVRIFNAKGQLADQRSFVLSGRDKEDAEVAFGAFSGQIAPPEVPLEQAPPPPPPATEETGTLNIRSAIADVSVSIDGEPRGLTPIKLEGLYASRYRVQAHKDGYYPWKGEVVVMPGATANVEIRMEPLPEGVTAAGTESTSSGLGKIRARTWIVGGAGAALLIVGGVFGARARSAQDDVDNQAIETPQDFAELEDRADSGKQSALIATISLAAGGAALVGAVVMAVFDIRSNSPTKKTSIAATPGGFSWDW